MRIGSDLDDCIGAQSNKVIKPNAPAALPSQQTLRKTISVDVEIDKNDIINWIMSCNDASVLKYISKMAINRSKAIENPNENPMRPRG